MERRYHLDIREVLPLKDLSVIQMGRLHCTERTVVNPHLHLDWYELTVVTEGVGTVYTGDVPTRMTAGDIYVSYPGDAHAIVSDEEMPLKYDFFAFRPTEEGLIRRLEELSLRRHGGDARVIRDDRIAHLVSNAIAERCSPEEDSPAVMEAIVLQLTAYLLRDLASLSSEKLPTHVGEGEYLCFQLMNYIDTHLYSLSNLEELARVTGYHYSHLSALFRKTTGGTLSDYSRTKRLGAARLLLQEGRRVGDVAELLGYSSAYAFSKAYRNHFGVSPRTDRPSGVDSACDL